MKKECYQIFITAPNKTFENKLIAVQETLEFALEEARHYKKMGMIVEVYDEVRHSLIKYWE